MIGKKCWNCHRTFKDTSASVRRSIPELSAVACLEKRWMFCGEAFIGLDYFRLKEPPILYPLLMPRKKQVQTSSKFKPWLPWDFPMENPKPSASSIWYSRIAALDTTTGCFRRGRAAKLLGSTFRAPSASAFLVANDVPRWAMSGKCVH